MKICYKETNFRDTSLELIVLINDIIDEYIEKGYDLTLRQVYYQLVARDIIANSERSYKNVGNLISDARMAGLIDWNAIVDRTRNLEQNSHWESPADIVAAASSQFQLDKWIDQTCYVEVWVEKDALKGIVGQVCRRLDVPYFSCRGYVSQSEMWSAANRLIKINKINRQPIILHLGDHDPSGKDMSRDIVERLEVFGVEDLVFERLALNYDQIELYNPPPNPTKVTDSRCRGYMEEFGTECWELDALKPEVIDSIITDNICRYIDITKFSTKKAEEAGCKRLLRTVAENWDLISEQYS